MKKEQEEKKIDIRDRLFAFIDLEMSGLDVEKHEILEIGLVLAKHTKGKNGRIAMEKVGEYEWKTKPKHIETADSVALSINKYNEKDWESAVSIKTALLELASLTSGAIMVGHNVAFDHSFLERAFRTETVENTMHYHKLDTISLAYAALFKDKSVTKFSLHELCEHFGIKNENAHTALSDTKATLELYKKLLPFFEGVQ